MNIFSPGSIGYTRTPIIYDGLDPIYDTRDEEGNIQLDLYPKERRQPDYGGLSVSVIPGPLVKETFRHGTTQRIHPTFYDGTSIITKHYSHSLFYNEYPSEYANYEAPDKRYNYFHVSLPEYFKLDATHISITNLNPSVYIFKRMDGYEFGDRSPPLQLKWHDGATAVKNAFCASWVPVYNVSTREEVDLGLNNFFITCRPWYQNPIVGPGENSDGVLSPLEWHIAFYDDTADGFFLPKIFTPYSGYFWNNGPTKRADQWYSSITYDGQFNSSDSGLGPTNSFGQFEVPVIDGEDENITAIHGVINFRGETKFLLTENSTNNPSESPLNAHANPKTSPYILVTPLYL